MPATYSVQRASMTTLLRLPQVQNEGQPAITGNLFRWQSLLPLGAIGGRWWLCLA
jgi:hypothetical protein